MPNAPSEVDSASEAAIIAVVAPSSDAVQRAAAVPGEVGGPPGPEPTRFGDWEKNGRCVDF